MKTSQMQRATAVTTITTDKSAYKKLQPLGEGTFGKVYLVQEVATKVNYVSKEIKLTNLDVV